MVPRAGGTCWAALTRMECHVQCATQAQAARKQLGLGGAAVLEPAPVLHSTLTALQSTHHVPARQGKVMDKGNTCQQPPSHQQGGKAQRAFFSDSVSRHILAKQLHSRQQQSRLQAACNCTPPESAASPVGARLARQLVRCTQVQVRVLVHRCQALAEAEVRNLDHPCSRRCKHWPQAQAPE